MAKHYKIKEQAGWQTVITPQNSDLTYLDFAILHSGNQKKYEGKTEQEEAVFVITKGDSNFYVEGKLFGKLKRKNVFEELPTSVFLPPFTKYAMEFGEESEICRFSCKTEVEHEAKFISSESLKMEKRGEPTYRRTVTDILSSQFPAEKLIVGETINDAGNWSSYPPHKHDRNMPPEEIPMEEIYFFKIAPETGFGIMRVYDDKEDNLFLLKNDDVVTIPKGYHPLTVAPKHQIYYLWALAGKERNLKPYTHPDYRF